MLNIAKNTFKEIVSLTIGESEKVIVDFGLGMIEIFGLIGVLFVGSQLLFKEVEGKTIFLILSKPIKRQDFMLGKFFGFSGTIGLIVLFQSILYLWVLFFKDIEISYLILWSLFFTFLKLEILLAIVFFFSSFMSNIMTIMMSLMVYLISHSFSLLIDLFIKFQDAFMLQIIRILQLLFPPLEALNIKDVIGSFEAFPPVFFLYNTVYALFYITLILFFATLIFSKKTFED